MKSYSLTLLQLIFIGIFYAQENHDFNVDSIVKTADSLFEKDDYSEALKLYEEAYSISEIKELEIKINTTRVLITEEKFSVFIRLADQYFEEKNFEKAKAFYIKSILIKPK
ncbi:MAG TPA: hypothetical protein VKX29_01765 [Brumimicrobium sp.]|nr:hypothetical protein [Brumimicrobium sp.]